MWAVPASKSHLLHILGTARKAIRADHPWKAIKQPKRQKLAAFRNHGKSVCIQFHHLLCQNLPHWKTCAFRLDCRWQKKDIIERTETLRKNLRLQVGMNNKPGFRAVSRALMINNRFYCDGRWTSGQPRQALITKGAPAVYRPAEPV